MYMSTCTCTCILFFGVWICVCIHTQHTRSTAQIVEGLCCQKYIPEAVSVLHDMINVSAMRPTPRMFKAIIRACASAYDLVEVAGERRRKLAEYAWMAHQYAKQSDKTLPREDLVTSNGCLPCVFGCPLCMFTPHTRACAERSYTYVCMYICMYIHIYVYIYIYVCMYVFMRVYIHTYIYIYIYECM